MLRGRVVLRFGVNEGRGGRGGIGIGSINCDKDGRQFDD
jgi:hypothetical protein